MFTVSWRRPLWCVIVVTLAQRYYPTSAFSLQAASGTPRSAWSLFSSSSGTPLQDLEIVDVSEGTGEVAKFETIVTIKYVGKMFQKEQEEWEQFDESTISFKLGFGKVLEGCDKGIRSMRVGGKRVLKIPSRLGFGSAGFSSPEYTVLPDTDLEYTVELKDVKSGPIAEAAAKLGIGLDFDTVYLK